jgi:hypothetical protein
MAFLTRDTFVVPQLKAREFIYTEDQERTLRPLKGRLCVYKFDLDRVSSEDEETFPEPTLLARFKLPEFSRHLQDLITTGICDPGTWWTSIHPRAPNDTPYNQLPLPFLTDPTNRLLAFEFMSNGPSILLMFTLTSTLLKLVAQNLDPQKDIEWADWGPMNTRFISDTRFSPSRFGRDTHGFKHVRLSRDDENQFIHILDFNPCLNIMHDETRPQISETLQEVEHTEPSVIEDLDLFEEPVETRLSYRQTIKKVPPEYTQFQAIMLDLERVIGIKEAWWDDDSFQAFAM